MPARGRGRKSKSGVCRSTPACNQREIAEKEATPEEEPTIHAQNDLEGGHSEDDISQFSQTLLVLMFLRQVKNRNQLLISHQKRSKV